MLKATLQVISLNGVVSFTNHIKGKGGVYSLVSLQLVVVVIIHGINPKNYLIWMANFLGWPTFMPRMMQIRE